jgi:hypothetical protein
MYEKLLEVVPLLKFFRVALSRYNLFLFRLVKRSMDTI